MVARVLMGEKLILSWTETMKFFRVSLVLELKTIYLFHTFYREICLNYRSSGYLYVKNLFSFE